jgi:hypothetical protein
VSQPIEPPIELEEIERTFAQVWAEQAELWARLRDSRLRATERQNLEILQRVADRGLAAMLRRRPVSAPVVLQLVDDFIKYGPVAVLSTGIQRGGDFLNNQLRGRWAEEVAISLLKNKPACHFGPSGAAMPGEEDHRRIVATFLHIQLLEGKRPDLLAFEPDVWDGLSEEAKKTIAGWPERLLRDVDQQLLTKASCAIEVKNSTWHYTTRRQAGGRPLAITVKEEELEVLSSWRARYGVPIIFMQILFDEIYCMSFQRLQAGITQGFVRTDGDYLRDQDTGAGGKLYHRFLLNDDTYLCGQVVFPTESVAEVRVLRDGNVVPYIVYRPAQGIEAKLEVIDREINFGSVS